MKDPNHHYECNVVEVDQEDGSVKVVLGAYLQSLNLRLSKGMLARDRIVLAHLAEQYSAPALVEYLGKHIIQVSKLGSANKTASAEERIYFQSFYKVGVALMAASIAIDALAQANLEKLSGEKEPTLTHAEFLARVKKIEKEMSKLDLEKKV